MNTETNQETGAESTNSTGDGEDGAETIAITKSDYEKLNQTLGSLKRELKDLKKTKDETPETSTTSQKPDEKLLEKLEKLSLRQAGVDHPDDIDLARKTAKKWGMDIDDVLMDEDFKPKLERQQAIRSNIVATSDVKGSGGTSNAKNTAEYWVAKGVPPTAADVPDRKTRAKIARAMMESSKSSKKFYND